MQNIIVSSCCRIPLWYEVKLLFVAWLVLPQFRGASFIYEKFVREQIRKHGVKLHHGHGHDAGHAVHVLRVTASFFN
jgi:receptor expression-enhancing protein 5/6